METNNSQNIWLIRIRNWFILVFFLTIGSFLRGISAFFGAHLLFNWWRMQDREIQVAEAVQAEKEYQDAEARYQAALARAAKKYDAIMANYDMFFLTQYDDGREGCSVCGSVYRPIYVSVEEYKTTLTKIHEESNARLKEMGVDLRPFEEQNNKGIEQQLKNYVDYCEEFTRCSQLQDIFPHHVNDKLDTNPWAWAWHQLHGYAPPPDDWPLTKPYVDPECIIPNGHDIMRARGRIYWSQHRNHMWDIGAAEVPQWYIDAHTKDSLNAA